MKGLYESFGDSIEASSNSRISLGSSSLRFYTPSFCRVFLFGGHDVFADTLLLNSNIIEIYRLKNRKG